VPLIYLETLIDAPLSEVFDLSRSIDLHLDSTKKTGEKVVAGRSTGLVELGDEIVWEAKHLGVTQQLSVRITSLERPHSFRDDMVKGAFKKMWHIHEFEAISGITKMIDKFYFESPFFFFGSIFDKIFLKKYMKNFLERKNRVLVEHVKKGSYRKFL